MKGLSREYSGLMLDGGFGERDFEVMVSSHVVVMELDQRLYGLLH